MRKMGKRPRGFDRASRLLVCLLAVLTAAYFADRAAAPAASAAENSCSRVEGDVAQQPSCDEGSTPKARTRPARMVDSGGGQPLTVRPAEPEQAAGTETRSLDGWPFRLRPPYGGLARAEMQDADAILIGNAAFLARRGAPAIPSELADPRPAHEGGYLVVRVGSPLSLEKTEELRLAGIHVLRYVPRGSYLMKVPPSSADMLAKIIGPQAIFRYEPAYKISPRIGMARLPERTAARRDPDSLRIRLSIFPGEDPAQVADQLRVLGAEILHATPAAPADPGLLPDGRSRAPRPSYVDVRLDRSSVAHLLPAAARLEGVRWIEEIAEYRMASDWTVSGWDYGNSRSAGADFLIVRQPWNNGLHGERVLLGDVDTGVDFDHAWLKAPVSPAVPQESPPTQACPGEGPKNSPKVPYYHLGLPVDSVTPVCYDQPSNTGNPDLFGHGTVTSGLMSADATASNSSTIDISSGTAPEAQIWMYDVGPASGSSLALSPADLSAELARMGQAGASAVNFSFTQAGADGQYDFLSEILDAAAWDNPGLLPVQAAGNDGADSGPKNTSSVDSTGKNVLTVGGNLDNSPNDLYSFSGRGPTADDRFKPDVISPALNALHSPNANPALDETLRLLSSDGNIASSNSGFLEGPEGTSFSCASVTGLAGVVAQYFKDGYYPTGEAKPADSSAPGNDLLKAVIVNSGLRMTGAGVLSDARPGKDQGWGRVKLNDPLYFSHDPATGDDARKLVYFKGSFAQGPTSCPADSETFRFSVFNVEQDLRVTLAWTDYPGDHNNPSAAQIVNDLDLIVRDPNGVVYRGNEFDDVGTGYSVTGGTSDRVNNLENVWLAASESLPVGVYTVEVCPYAINAGARQNYSLVITGGVRAGEKVQFDRLGYTCSDTAGIKVTDLTAPGPTVSVAVTSLSTGDSETLVLPASGMTGVFAGTIQTAQASGPPAIGDGILQVADGETIRATYLASTDSAVVECTPEACYANDLGPDFRQECDNDGFADNGETIRLYLPIRNSEGFLLSGATATLTSNNSHVTVVSGTATYGAIAPGAVAYPDSDGSDDPFVISVAGAACDEAATLTLTVIQGTGWSSAGCTSWSIPLRLNRDPFPIQAYDFDDGTPQGWTHVMAHGSTTSRECAETYFDVWNTFPTTARSQSGSYSMRLGNGSYRTMVDAALVSPSLDVPSGGARLRFYYWMDADYYDPNQVWHGFIVEARRTSGGSWTQLTPTGGYNALAARNDCAYFFPFANTSPNWLRMFGGDGTGSAYTGDAFDREWVVDLASYASQTIQVRFRFGSDDYPSSAEGLYIDTVTLEGFDCETPDVCDDGNTCTTETCQPSAGGCQYTPLPDGNSCTDGEVCTTGDQCAAGVCRGTDVISCNDGNVCTDDRAVDNGDGVCNNPSLDCRHTNNSAPCNDANACTTQDICSAGACTGGPALVCDDLNPCTNNSCNTSTGCVYTNNTAPCGDGFSCTEGDTCSGGACVATPNHLLCDDLNVCTSDTCSPADPSHGLDGCIHPPVPNGTACDDADVCTVTQSCQAGVCTGQQNLNCSDGAACTWDLCDPNSGCSNPGIDNDADAYDICGTGDPVNPDGLPKDCNDANPDVNPGAAEDCYNSIDDNCNGLTDAADTVGCPRCKISGTATYYRTSAGVEPGTNKIPNATMTMVGTASGTTTTNTSGYYQFLNILKGQVAVTPKKTGDLYSGISSLDASRISQYRVGLYTMTPNQLVASDVSGNGSVSSYDASLISQLRVGIITRFPVATANGSDWAFVPVLREYSPIDSDRLAEDYLAILYGDVTGNWAAGGGGGGASVPGAAVVPEAAGSGEAGEAAAGPTPERGTPEGVCYLSLRPLPRRGLPAGQRRYALHARHCAGILGLDVDFAVRSASASIVAVKRAQDASQFEMNSRADGGISRVSLFGSRPFQGGGDLLELVVKQKGSKRKPVVSFAAVANEGQIAISRE